jgi:hypothetical protein
MPDAVLTCGPDAPANSANGAASTAHTPNHLQTLLIFMRAP